MSGPVPPGWTRRALRGLPVGLEALWTRRAEDGTWRYGALYDERHCNAQGFVHGGALMTLLDHGLSLLLWEAVGRAPCATVHLDCHFLAPLRAPCFVELDGRILKRGRNTAFLRGTLLCRGEPVAEATGVWSVLDRERDFRPEPR
ncbi:MAG: hypothetical protein KatS3mg124_0606 [Porticoccaceae bacterium]|nr:MAG: hypothetical protein KatS3mg124_0606 [Porticoccaceae bacterium]